MVQDNRDSCNKIYVNVTPHKKLDCQKTPYDFDFLVAEKERMAVNSLYCLKIKCIINICQK